MKKIKLIAGITWAFLCLILIIVLFPGLNGFSSSAAKLPFMKINPNYTGGEVAREIIAGSCTLDIRKPVFNGLFRERKNGFVQLDWRGTVPEKIVDTIDYDFDSKPDFCIFVDRKQPKTSITRYTGKVNDILISTPTSYGWAVRVKLMK